MTRNDIKLDGLSVCIGMPIAQSVPALTVKSLFSSQSLCLRMGIQCELAMIAGNAVIQWARDEVTDLLLKSNANRFFMIDSDIVWEPEDFMRLLALSQERKVVCASYPAKKDEPTFYIRYDNSQPLTADKYGLLEIQGAGLGFAVIHREVIEKLCDDAEKIYDEISGNAFSSLFRVSFYEGKRRGEDMAFFDDINNLGYKIYLDPSITLGHIGYKVYRGKAMDAMRPA